MSEIILGGGCFWCLEAIFNRVKGVKQVISGYAGGNTNNPNYRQVCSGETGHAEVIKIIYDSKEISLDEILNIFWKIHDPTTLNQQGADVGSQYRSIILYQNPEQKEIIENSKKELTESNLYSDKIVTEIKALDTFFPAEEYHQNYYQKNQTAPYCRAVIDPKLKKFFG